MKIYIYDPYQLYRQPGSAMGEAGRDPPVCLHQGTIIEGTNEVYVHCHDERAFCVVMHLVVRRSLDEVKSMVPAPATFPLAKSMLELKLRGQDSLKGETDADIIIQDNVILSLRCPISGMICRTPARTRQCLSLAIFDLDTFIELNAKVRKWTCPHCGVTGRPRDIIIDSYLARVLGVLHARERLARAQSIDRIEIEASGRWRPVVSDQSEGNYDAQWISAEAMLGVVLGVGGSVLHVPSELVAADESVHIAAKISRTGSIMDSVGLGDHAKATDKELRRAAGQVHAQFETVEARARSRSAAEMIVISESDEDDAPKGSE